MEQSAEIGHIALALAKAQSQMSNASKDAKNPHLNNKYASLAAVREACIGPLSANEVAVTQFVDDAEPGKIRVTTQLTHSSGQWLRCSMSASYGGNRGVTEVQSIGSVVTYLRRYTLAAIVGITQEDDDGASAPKPQRPAEPQSDPVYEDMLSWSKAHNLTTDRNRILTALDKAEDKAGRAIDSAFLAKLLKDQRWSDWLTKELKP